MLTVRALAVAAVVALFMTSLARAGSNRSVGGEVWFGGGVNSPDYHDGEIVVGSGGLGVLLFDHVSVGANVQVDRDHWFGFGYVGAALPAVGAVQPYGRFHAGQRDDLADGVTQWSAGLRYGVDAVKFYLEVFSIIQPGEATGVCLGIVF